MSYLVFIRHAESELNAAGLISGKATNPHLTEKGHLQAREAAKQLAGIHFDHAFTSARFRTRETLEEVLKVLGQPDIPITENDAIDERSWGILEATSLVENEQNYPKNVFESWFKWEGSPPGGETYEEIRVRAMGYLEKEVFPLLQSGKNVLIANHNGTMKVMCLCLEKRPTTELPRHSLSNCQIFVYEVDSAGTVTPTELT